MTSVSIEFIPLSSPISFNVEDNPEGTFEPDQTTGHIGGQACEETEEQDQETKR